MSDESKMHSDVVRLLSDKLPGIKTLSGMVARNTVQRLLGYWVMWHMAGGLQRMIDLGLNSQTSAYRQRNEFRHVFGVEVWEFYPEVASILRRDQEPLISDDQL